MHPSVKTLLLYLCLITSFSCWSSASFAFVASDMRVIVVSPFSYSEDGVPQNVKEEMAIDVDLPQETADYFKSVNAFKRRENGTDLFLWTAYHVHRPKINLSILYRKS